jgi:hypothetical protein
MQQTKVSQFRQTGWKEIATDEIHEYYGSDMPVQDGSFVKLWDSWVQTSTITEPYANQDVVPAPVPAPAS